jgi:hypothetical protein
LGLAGENPMMPAPPKVGALEPVPVPVPVDKVPPEDVLPLDPAVPELSVPDEVPAVPPEPSVGPVPPAAGD